MAKLTRKAIMFTFENMLREMPFDKITVSALVARCDISSNTFYYHYQDIYHLLDEWLELKLSKYPTEAYLSDDWKPVTKALLHDIQDNPEIVSHVFDSIPRERLERYVFDTMEPAILQLVRHRTAGRDIPEEALKVLAGAFCYTMVGFILKFIYRGMKDDIDAEFNPIITFLDDSFIRYIRQEDAERASK